MLIHGAWHDSQCWSALTPALSARGFSVHTPDLPGHGNNPLDSQRITLKAYAAYISQYIDNINNSVILVGHSMSGMVISAVAEMQPEKVARLVYLSAYLPESGDSLFSLIEANREALGEAAIEQAMILSPDKRHCSIEKSGIKTLFYSHCTDASLVPATFPLQATLPLSGKVVLSAGRFGRVARTYICCLHDQVIPITHQRHMLARQPCDEMVQLDADHSPFASCPRTLAAILNSACSAG